MSLYRQLANKLIIKIKNKQLIPGEKLPSIRQYALQQNVSIYPSPFKMQVLIRLKNIFTALLNLK
ncbi:MAG: GntR family transcriptional regulator [Alteromonadaceae bacterium]|nr:GntR family transcriptional regulator [Alteromonadaceae bacterium]